MLWGFRWFEKRVERYQRAELSITIAGDSLSADDLRARLEAAKFHIKSLSVTHSISEGRRKLDCEVRWPSLQGSAEVPAIVNELEALPGIVDLAWRGIASGPQ